MRGYLSFLLVLCIMVCIFAFLQPFPALHSASESRAIEAERTNGVSMNVKETLILSTSYWLRSSALAYDSVAGAKGKPVERELAIKTGILSGWALLSLHEFDSDFEVEFWCAEMTHKTKQELSVRMIGEGRVISPDSTNSFPMDCAGFIDLAQKTPPGGKDSVSLGYPQIFKVVGASIYSPRYQTANVVYIPHNLVIE